MRKHIHMNRTLALDPPLGPRQKQVRSGLLHDPKQLSRRSPFLYLALVRRRQILKTASPAGWIQERGGTASSPYGRSKTLFAGTKPSPPVTLVFFESILPGRDRFGR